jgi:hypothetical protein
MKYSDVSSTERERAHQGDARSRRLSRSGATWSFVYIFFTNGIPFDAPNRSEPCPPS